VVHADESLYLLRSSNFWN